MPASTPSERWDRSKALWNVLTYYQRFETAVAFVVTGVIALIVLVALYRLCIGVVTALMFGAVNPLQHEVFQAIFGEIMTLRPGGQSRARLSRVDSAHRFHGIGVFGPFVIPVALHPREP